MVTDEDLERAEAYALIGALFTAPPDRALADNLGELAGDDSDLGQCVADLAAAARATSIEDMSDEFSSLFYTLNVRDEVSPNAAVHLTGSLFGHALLKLREDLGELGIAKADGVAETEDHVSVVCQVMAGVLAGKLGKQATPEQIAEFYKSHVATWMPMFATNVAQTKGLRFYAAVGRFTRKFLASETARFG